MYQADNNEKDRILKESHVKDTTKLMKNMQTLIKLKNKAIVQNISLMPYENLFGQIPEDDLSESYKKVKSFKRNISEHNILKSYKSNFEKEMRHHRKLTTEDIKMRRHREHLSQSISRYLGSSFPTQQVLTTPNV